MLKRVYFAVFIMGFTALVAEAVLIREFFITFNGNELTIGIVLANWILLVAIGSMIGGYAVRKIKSAVTSYALIQFAIFLYFPAAIFLIRVMKPFLGFGVGESVGNLFILASSFIIISLLGIPMGFRFPVACRMAREASGRAAESIGAVYFIEALGFIVAGPVITYLLITKMDSFSTAFLMSALTVLSSAVILPRKAIAAGAKVLFGISAALTLAAILLMAGPSSYVNNESLDIQWRGQKLLRYENSIYGNLAVTERLGQYTFYSNGMPIISSPYPDIWHIEDLVHFAMLSSPDPKHVLLIGGGAGGVINEILKYPIEKLTYAELDPELIKLVESFPTELTKKELIDPRLEIKYIDGILLVDRMRSRGEAADVVIMNLPMPSTLQLNRFYTIEFFRSLKEIMPDNGIFVFTLPGSLSALSPELIDLNGVILKTLDGAFRTFVVPGYSNIYISSAAKIEITPELLCRRMAERGVTAEVFNGQYAEDRLSGRWIKWFKESLARCNVTRINSDLLPIGMYYAVSYWNAIFSRGARQFTGLLGRINVLVLLFMVMVSGALAFMIKAAFGLKKRYAAGWAVFTTGFAGMSLNLMVIYAYQSFHGYVFSHIALLIAAFMAGLSLASYAMTRSLKDLKDASYILMKIEMFAVVMCGAIGVLLFVRMPAPLYFAAAVIPGILIGLEFPVANKIYIDAGSKDGSGGLLYAIDLFGSWGAALVTSFVLVPLVGIMSACLALAALKAFSLALVASSRR